MATTTQTVIIEFQADFSAVSEAVDILEKAGKVDAGLAATFRKTNQEISKQGAVFKTTATSAQGSVQSFSKLNDLLQKYPKSGMKRFLLEVGNELAGAGLKAEDFYKKLDPKDAIPKQITLKRELKLLKEQMQEAALAGGVLGEEYLRLKKRAGELDDTIKDVGNDIANAGSDTRGIDNVVGSISALAGGFSAIQGAAALFGDESEELQKTLLRVNAAMAFATGLQQISTALQKEGSLARIADTIATGTQIAVQKIYTAVTGRATVATIAFKVALAATGIGLVVIAVLALSQAFKKSNKDLEEATRLIESQNRGLESMNTLLQQTLSIDLARAAAAGKAESDLVRIRGRALQAQRANLTQNNADLAKQRDALSGTSAAYGKLNAAIDENNTKIKEVDTQIIVEGFNLQKSLADEQTKRSDDAASKAKENGEKALKAARERRALEFADFQAGIELKLLSTKEGSREELDLQKKLLRAKLQIDLEGEGLSINQRKLLVQQFFKESGELSKKYNKEIADVVLADEKARLDIALLNLNLNEETKLELRIEALNKAADHEKFAAGVTAEQIKFINAKLQSDIVALKIESIQKAADYEISLASAQGGGARRALEAVAGNEKQKSDIRINAINQLADIENAAIDKQIKANREAAAIQGSDQKALDLVYEQLLDQKLAKSQETEEKITKLTENELKLRQERTKEYINLTLSALQQVGAILSEFESNANQRIQNDIEGRKKEVEDLLSAGAITEKEAERRNKRIEAEEKKAKIRSAQQQKSLALFNATITGAQAIMQAIASAPPPFNVPAIIITSALVTAQIAAIASRPIPKFATGKKGNYSGVAEVGEAGAELIQRADGSMEVAANRQLVYLGSRDKVFTAGETKNILPMVNKKVMAPINGSSFDYNRMAAAMGNKTAGNTNINIDKEFISESVASGLMKVKYYDRYYSSK